MLSNSAGIVRAAKYRAGYTYIIQWVYFITLVLAFFEGNTQEEVAGWIEFAFIMWVSMTVVGELLCFWIGKMIFDSPWGSITGMAMRIGPDRIVVSPKHPMFLTFLRLEVCKMFIVGLVINAGFGLIAHLLN